MGIISGYVEAVQARHHHVWAVISVDFTKGPPRVGSRSWTSCERRKSPQRARTRTTRAVGVARSGAARECASLEIRSDARRISSQ
jgi:hypothetical protein